MGLAIFELFGHRVDDRSQPALEARSKRYCPFLKGSCVKSFHDGVLNGVCSVKQPTKPAVICCPFRLYADGHQILKDVASSAFERDVELIYGADIAKYSHDGNKVVVFGKRWGKELRLPKKSGVG